MKIRFNELDPIAIDNFSYSINYNAGDMAGEIPGSNNFSLNISKNGTIELENDLGDVEIKSFDVETDNGEHLNLTLPRSLYLTNSNIYGNGESISYNAYFTSRA